MMADIAANEYLEYGKTKKGNSSNWIDLRFPLS